MKRDFKQKFNIFFVILLLCCFLFFQSFLIMEKHHECSNDDCFICEVVNEAGRSEKVSLTTSYDLVIPFMPMVFVPFLFVFIYNLFEKETPIRLKVRMNN